MLNLNPRRTYKKGSKGIGVLFLFIALILIAVSVSALIYYNSQKLSEKGNENLEKAEGQFKHMQVVEVSGYDGREQTLTSLTVDAKLSMNSEPIDLRELSISIGEEDYRSMLAYRGSDAPVEESNQGYNTWTDQEFGELTYTINTFNPMPRIDRNYDYYLPLDLDGDDTDDIVHTCDSSNCPAEYEGTHLKFTLSSGSVAYAELRNDDGSLANIASTPTDLDVTQSPIIGARNGKTYGSISLSGTVDFQYEIESTVNVTLQSNGYLLDADVDDDGEDDYMGLNATHFLFYVSSHDEPLSYPLGADLSDGPQQTLDVDQKVTNEQRYGTIKAQGTTTEADKIDADVDVRFNPYHNGQGYYVAEHLVRDKKSKDYYMLPGDIVRFHVEAYRNISTDEIIRIRYFYHNLESPPKDVFVGNTFPNKRKVHLYPEP
ncbi:MAG: hypothetical protein ACLFO2_00910 [Candidatus Woesearchaeota archaeon]